MQNIVNEYDMVLSLANVEMQGFIKNYDDYLKALYDANDTFNKVVKDDGERKIKNNIVKALFNKVNQLKKGIVYINKFVKKYQSEVAKYEEKDCDLLKEYKKTLKEYNKLYINLENQFKEYLLDCISFLDLTTGDIFTDTEFKL